MSPEAIPYLGIAVLITGTAYELYEACQSIKDPEELYGELGLDEAPREDVMAAACDPQLPSAGAVWGSVKGEALVRERFWRGVAGERAKQ